MNKKTISVIVFLLSLFTACNMAGPELKESSGQEQNPEQGQEQSPVEDGKVAVRLHIEAEGAPARTVRPTVALNDAAKWRLSGAKDGGDSAELKEFTGDSDTVYLEAGSWDFVLDGYNASNTLILSGSLDDQTIAEADSNSLSFTVAPVSGGTGTVKLTVTMPAGFISRVDVAREGATPTSKTPSPVSGDSTRESIVFEAAYGTGEYYFIIKLWKDSELYGVVSELVYVRGGLTSEKTYELQRSDLNLTYIINYHEWDGLETTRVEEAYYRKTDADITLREPPAVQDHVFKGWYETPLNLLQEEIAFQEPSQTPVITLDTDDMEDKHYYPYWKLVTVPSSLNLADSLAWISSHVEPDQTYTITVKNNEPSIAPQTLSYSGQTVGITLIGDSEERIVSLSSTGALFTVEDGVTLTLGNHVTLEGRADNTASLANVNAGGTLHMETGSKITGNTASDGGGVYVNSGTFTMSGGEISGNTGSSGGGVAVANSGTFEMNGGKISGNTVSGLGGGGGVYVSGSGATFEMSGGEISGNSASGGGGGVYMLGGGTFTMSGGEISRNNASSGGGVYVDSGTFTKSGGTIYGSNGGDALKNTATNGDANGPAVYVNSGSKRRVTTAGTGVDLNSGTDANWEYAAGVAIALKVDPSDPTLGNTAMTTAEPGSFSVDAGYASYQWYWNGELDSGATSNTYTWAAGRKPAGIHELSVRVIDADGEELSASCRVTISN